MALHTAAVSLRVVRLVRQSQPPCCSASESCGAALREAGHGPVECPPFFNFVTRRSPRL